jgi:hypothetical protein
LGIYLVVKSHRVVHIDFLHKPNYSPCAKFSLPTILVNKVLLKHSYTHLFLYCLWLFQHYNDNIK